MLTVLFIGQVFLNCLGGAYCHIDIALSLISCIVYQLITILFIYQ